MITDFDLLGKIKIVLITNGSMVHRPEILRGIEALGRLGGELWFKIDASKEPLNAFPFQRSLLMGRRPALRKTGAWGLRKSPQRHHLAREACMTARALVLGTRGHPGLKAMLCHRGAGLGARAALVAVLFFGALFLRTVFHISKVIVQ